MKNDFFAVILAAGVGSRMGKIRRPKCLIEIDNKPLLIYQLAALKKCGIALEKIVVITGFKQKMVRKAGGPNINYIHNPEFATQGMLISILCSRRIVKDNPFVLLYGDTIFVPQIIETVLKTKGEIVLAVDSQTKRDLASEDAFEVYDGIKQKKGSTKVVIGEDRAIRRLTKDAPNTQTASEYIGIAKFNKKSAKEVFDIIEKLKSDRKIKDFPSPSYLFNLLIERGHKIIPAFIGNLTYQEIDYTEDIKKAQKIVESLRNNFR